MNEALSFSALLSAGCHGTKCRRKHRDTGRADARLRIPDVRATPPHTG